MHGSSATLPRPVTVRVSKAGPVTTIEIDRPDARNAVDLPTARALATAFREFESDEAASVAVLSGAGKTFCAGADLKALGTATGLVVSPDGDGPMGPSRMVLSKPVIAAISGYAVAGGLELALWCDLRVADSDAVLGVFCRRFGVPLIDGGTVRLPRLIGLSHALDLILTGRAVQATEALSMGLVNRVVEPGTSLVAAQTLAAQIAAFPQGCLRGDRLSAYEQADLDFSAAMRNEFDRGRAAASTEAVAGAQRFAKGEGRHGDFE